MSFNKPQPLRGFFRSLNISAQLVKYVVITFQNKLQEVGSAVVEVAVIMSQRYKNGLTYSDPEVYKYHGVLQSSKICFLANSLCYVTVLGWNQKPWVVLGWTQELRAGVYPRQTLRGGCVYVPKTGSISIGQKSITTNDSNKKKKEKCPIMKIHSCDWPDICAICGQVGEKYCESNWDLVPACPFYIDPYISVPVEKYASMVDRRGDMVTAGVWECDGQSQGTGAPTINLVAYNPSPRKLRDLSICRWLSV